MKINMGYLNSPELWEAAGIKLPQYHVEAMREKTRLQPEWIHFGAGNIFRAFLAAASQDLLDQRKTETGVITVASAETIDKMYKPYDNLFLDVSIHGDGAFDVELVASVAESLVGNPNSSDDWERLRQLFAAPSLKMVSFTVTEKGYVVDDKEANLIRVITRLMYERYQSGRYPIALVSMDNCSHNGERLREAVLAVAQEGVQSKGYPTEYFDYLKEESKVAFPWTMIDKITPRPSEEIQDHLESKGLSGIEMIVTSKNTYIAPFVNSESNQYLFIEDNFPNGRVPLDQASGIWFTDRETVNAVESMKVNTCLNPLHTAIAIFGRLLGIELVRDAIRDKDIRALVEKIGNGEGMKVVTDPGIIRPEDFLNEVVNQRFPNPFIPDTTTRIATDTSQKLGVRFGETIKAYAADEKLKASELEGIPLVIAAWCRYLMGKDDLGEPLVLSPDPLLEELRSILAGAELGSKDVDLKRILTDQRIFNFDLYEVGLGEKIETYFHEMNAAAGAVRKTLSRIVGN